MHSKKLIAGLLLALFALSACGKRISKTYVDDQKKVLYAYRNHDFKKALKYADEFTIKVNKEHNQDTFVAILERGKIAMDAGSYAAAIKDLQRAEKRFLDIEGTISMSEEASSLFLDDTTKEYEAQPLEKIMISPYLALSYWASGDFSGARVERNRTINKINQYIETKAGSNYLENPFARYLSAIIYENEKKFQDAKIEYRKIMKTRKFTKSFIQPQLDKVKKNPKLSDLVVFVDLGKSPIKHEKAYKSRTRSKGKSVVVSITYAVYKPRRYAVKRCRVLVDGQDAGETELIYDLSRTIMKQYQKNKGKLIRSLVARAALKVVTQAAGNAMMKSKDNRVKAVGLAAKLFGAVSSAIERADLRSWITLPAEVQAQRVSQLSPGEHTVQLVYLSASGNEIGRSNPKKVIVRDGEIVVTQFRVVK